MMIKRLLAHKLIIVFLLLAPILEIIPSTVVVLKQTDQGAIDNPSKIVLLLPTDDISRADKCLSAGFDWDTGYLGSAFQIWSFLQRLFIIVMPVYFMGTYIQKQRLGSGLIVIVFVIWIFLSLGYILSWYNLFGLGRDYLCNPGPIYRVLGFYPYWPAILAWLSCLLLGIFALRRMPKG
jgi:hypothetical protein